MKQRIPTAIAILIGFVTLAGYFLGPDFGVHLLFIRWASVLAAIALVLGILNLLGVHFRRIANTERNWPYSIALIIAALAVIGIGLMDGSPTGKSISWIFDSMLFPLEAAAASLLLFFLVAAAFRVMRKKPSVPTFVFVVTTVVILAGSIPLPENVGGILAGLRNWLVRVFATAGARGMLLGVALGTIATGLRVLMGIDKPHSEREP